MERLAEGPAEALIGHDLGPYHITGILGRGGMSVVYRAIQTSVNRPVALKVLPAEWAADPSVVERFLREAHAAAALQHPNIVPIYDAGQIDGHYCIAMRLVEGIPLARAIPRTGLPITRVVAIVEQIAAALDYAHARGVIHRDVSAGNVLLEDGDRVTLLDFGIAQAGAGSRLTRTGIALGTLEYLSPEQARGQPATARSDVYALGVLTYELFAGALPFTAPDDRSLALKHLTETPPSLQQARPDVPARMAAAVARCLAKDPAARFASAGAFAAQLRAVLSDTRRSTTFVPVARPPRTALRKKPLAALAALAIVLLFFALYQTGARLAAATAHATGSTTLQRSAARAGAPLQTTAATAGTAATTSASPPTPVPVLNVPATNPSMAVQGFYNALNSALTGDPAGFLRAYSYLSAGARAATPYPAFVARYQVDTAAISFGFPAPAVAESTATAVVTTTEIQANQRLVQQVTWHLIDTPAGWRLDSATVAAGSQSPPPDRGHGRHGDG